MGQKLSAVTGVRSDNVYQPGNAINELWLGKLEIISHLPFTDSDMAQAGWPKGGIPKIPWHNFIIPLKRDVVMQATPEQCNAPINDWGDQLSVLLHNPKYWWTMPFTMITIFCQGALGRMLRSEIPRYHPDILLDPHLKRAYAVSIWRATGRFLESLVAMALEAVIRAFVHQEIKTNSTLLLLLELGVAFWIILSVLGQLHIVWTLWSDWRKTKRHINRDIKDGSGIVPV